METACAEGRLDAALELYWRGPVDIPRAFVAACRHGHVELAEWLHSVEAVDVREGWRAAQETWMEACYQGCEADVDGSIGAIIRWLAALNLFTVMLHHHVSTGRLVYTLVDAVGTAAPLVFSISSQYSPRFSA